MPDKTTVSNAKSYKEIGEFWDCHDATEFGEKTEVELEVSIQSQHRYYPIDNQLLYKLKEEAQKRGISGEALINLWLQERIEKLSKQKTKSA